MQSISQHNNVQRSQSASKRNYVQVSHPTPHNPASGRRVAQGARGMGMLRLNTPVVKD